jgi:signal transduction histidine kinase
LCAGIKKQDMPLLFKAFSQLDSSTNRKFQGTGADHLSLVRPS